MAVTFTKDERTCLLAFYRMAQTTDSEARNREALFLRDRAATAKSALAKLTSADAVADPPPQPSMLRHAQAAVKAVREEAVIAEAEAKRAALLAAPAPSAEEDALEALGAAPDEAFEPAEEEPSQSNDDEPVAILEDEKA